MWVEKNEFDEMHNDCANTLRWHNSLTVTTTKSDGIVYNRN